MKISRAYSLKRSFSLLAGALFFLPYLATTNAQLNPADGLSKEGVDFFERKIRPVLVNQCYQCHSAATKKPAGGLRLDTRAGMLKGGASGAPAIIAGAPEKSLLIKAIRHADAKLQMPMSGKLPATVIRDFETWIKKGAPDLPAWRTRLPADGCAWKCYQRSADVILKIILKKLR